MEKCKYCGAEIIFIKTPKGRIMPCEAEKIEVWASPNGTSTAVRENGEVFKCESGPIPFRFSEWAYQSHFVNCPWADRARRKR